MQCQGALVMWLLTNMLMLWVPTEKATSNVDQKCQTDQAVLVNINQALPISSMMRQIGAALTQGRAHSAQDVQPVAALLADAVQSDHWYVIPDAVL